ncbi:MAG: FKBP-type peptidyl-prolyl cis-trans isomerase [Bacteroidales bacterium]
MRMIPENILFDTGLRICLFLAMLMAFGCNNDPPVYDVSEQGRKQMSEQQKKREKMMDVNKEIVGVEEQLMENYIRRHKLNVTRLKNGIRYDIYKENPGGRKVKEGDEVHILFSSRLLTGKEVQAKDTLKEKHFQVNRSEDIQGLHYAVMEMKEGEKGVFVIPSNLAYGITGKAGEVPHSAALVYDVELLNVNPE